MPVLHPAASVPDGMNGDQPLPLRNPGSQGHLLLPLAAYFPKLVKEAPRQAVGIQHCCARWRVLGKQQRRPADAPLALPAPPSCGLYSSPDSPITGLHRPLLPITPQAQQPNTLCMASCVISSEKCLAWQQALRASCPMVEHLHSRSPPQGNSRKCTDDLRTKNRITYDFALVINNTYP